MEKVSIGKITCIDMTNVKQFPIKNLKISHAQAFKSGYSLKEIKEGYKRFGINVEFVEG